MNVAIVGGRSLLKADLCEALRDQTVILRLDQELSDESTTACEVHPCDFQDIVACEAFLSGIDCVIYTGLNWTGRKQDDIYDQIVDIGCIVNEALNNKSRVIFISDVLSVGHHPNAELYDESLVWNQSIEWSYPGFMYHLAEREIYRGISEGIEAVVVRPSFMLGSYEEKEVFLSQVSSPNTSKRVLDERVSIVSRTDVVQLIIKLTHIDAYDYRFVNSTGHALSIAEFTSAVGSPEPEKKWYDYFYMLWAKLTTRNIPTLLHRPDGLSIEYDNRRSLDWIGMDYLDLESTLTEFQV